jgi:hypothetical protein
VATLWGATADNPVHAAQAACSYSCEAGWSGQGALAGVQGPAPPRPQIGRDLGVVQADAAALGLSLGRPGPRAGPTRRLPAGTGISEQQ